ncbi:hypothetical protein [Thioalkalivibrio thiocyanodenitrificans]|uniref:hypothetical protein n=1 Tax=Thioalkalivibrio thiocyanodenitrificans TaxID=243063 RepID=UPI0003694FEB|nr:hypothetical protein [Thioalkalivibrio thiocyanodenitrificans]
MSDYADVNELIPESPPRETLPESWQGPMTLLEKTIHIQALSLQMAELTFRRAVEHIESGEPQAAARLLTVADERIHDLLAPKEH